MFWDETCHKKNSPQEFLTLAEGSMSACMTQLRAGGWQYNPARAECSNARWHTTIVNIVDILYSFKYKSPLGRKARHACTAPWGGVREERDIPKAGIRSDEVMGWSFQSFITSISCQHLTLHCFITLIFLSYLTFYCFIAPWDCLNCLNCHNALTKNKH